MKKEFKKVHEHYRKNYFNGEIADRIKENVHQDIKNSDINEPKKKPRHSLMKKVSYATAACFILFGLFVGSAFVSPAMAEVASKIPFLNRIFEAEPMHEALSQELEDKGYKISGTGYTVRGKIYHITVAGSEEYYNQVKGDIKEIAEDVISARGYDSFKVEVEMERTFEPDVDLEKEPKYQAGEQLSEILTKVIPELQQQGYKIDMYGIMYPDPDTDEIRVDINIEDTEKRTDEIEKAIYEGMEEQAITIDFSIEFHPFNVQAREIESKWTADILPVIWEGMLSNKEYKTKGVGYSFKKGTMNIFITTTVKKSDNDAPELANKIEKAIDDFLQSDDLKDSVGDTPYKVVVRDKDSKEIK